MSKVKDYMQSPVYVIDKEEPVQRARNLMLKHYISRLLVMDGEKLAGIVTKHDISHRLSQAAPEWRRRPISKVPIRLVMTDRPIAEPVMRLPVITLESANRGELRVVESVLRGHERTVRYQNLKTADETAEGKEAGR